MIYTNTELLAQKIEQSRYSKSELARNLGVAPSKIWLILKGKLYPRPVEIAILSKLLNLSDDDVIQIFFSSLEKEEIKKIDVQKEDARRKDTTSYKFVNTALLHSAIDKRGLTIKQIAQAIDVSSFVVGAIVSDNYKPMTETIRKLARVLKLSKKEIIQIFFSPFDGGSNDELLERDRTFNDERKSKKQLKD